MYKLLYNFDEIIKNGNINRPENLIIKLISPAFSSRLTTDLHLVHLTDKMSKTNLVNKEAIFSAMKADGLNVNIEGLSEYAKLTSALIYLSIKKEDKAIIHNLEFDIIAKIQKNNPNLTTGDLFAEINKIFLNSNIQNQYSTYFAEAVLYNEGYANKSYWIDYKTNKPLSVSDSTPMTNATDLISHLTDISESSYNEIIKFVSNKLDTDMNEIEKRYISLLVIGNTLSYLMQNNKIDQKDFDSFGNAAFNIFKEIRILEDNISKMSFDLSNMPIYINFTKAYEQAQSLANEILRENGFTIEEDKELEDPNINEGDKTLTKPKTQVFKPSAIVSESEFYSALRPSVFSLLSTRVRKKHPSTNMFDQEDITNNLTNISMSKIFKPFVKETSSLYRQKLSSAEIKNLFILIFYDKYRLGKIPELSTYFQDLKEPKIKQRLKLDLRTNYVPKFNASTKKQTLNQDLDIFIKIILSSKSTSTDWEAAYLLAEPLLSDDTKKLYKKALEEQVESEIKKGIKKSPIDELLDQSNDENASE